MMEESICSNLKTKALVILLIASLVFAGSSFFSSVRAADEEEIEEISQEMVETEKPEIKLNRKINFQGNTYKSYKEGAKVKKTYKDDELGCGIILRIKKNATYGIYVLGEGWISEDQVVESTKFIKLSFDLTENGLESGLKIDGEFTNVDIANTAVASFENGEIKVGIDGSTNIVLTKKDGTEINALATTHQGNITLNIDQKSISADFIENATILEKVEVVADANGTVALSLEEDGKLAIDANGEANLNVTTTEGEELLDVRTDATGRLELSLDEINVSGEAHQDIIVLSDKIKASLNERASAKVNKTQVEATAGADLTVNETEVGKVDGEIEYTYGEADPTGNIEGHLLGKEFTKAGTIPVISTIKSLLNKMPSLVH